ncbi:MAG: outer membrane beta-barrel protein [Devosiaceae bacterium]|nr:outer membrane beta-barrel protein [Devosiaceae bacterium]
MMDGRFLFAFAVLAAGFSSGVNAQQGDGSGSSNPQLYASQNNQQNNAVHVDESADYSLGCIGGCENLDISGLLPLSSIREVSQSHVGVAPDNLAAQGKEPFDPFFEVDWSIGISAASRVGSDPVRNSLSVTPEFSLTNIGLRSQFLLGANASFSISDAQLIRVEAIGLSYEGAYALDALTRLNSSINIDLSQGDASAPGVPGNVVQLPLQLSARGEAGIERQFGRFGLSGSIEIERNVQTPTLLSGNIEQDNSDRNFLGLGGNLRASYEITPNLVGFIAGDLMRNWYDAAPVLPGIKLDGWDMGLRGGAQLNWRDVLVSEFSVGYQLRSFDDASIVQLGATIFGVDVNYTPNNAISAGVQLATSLTPQDLSNLRPASVDYSAAVNVGYQLNSIFGLRGNASGEWVRPVSGNENQTSLGVGAGADFTINKNLLLSADYSYSWTQRVPNDDEYAHALILGMRFSR